MLGKLSEIKSGSILIDEDGKILYSSIISRYEANRFLDEVRALHKIKSGAFGVERHGDYWVVLQEIIDKKHVFYLIEYKEISNGNSLRYCASEDIMNGRCNRSIGDSDLSFQLADNNSHVEKEKKKRKAASGIYNDLPELKVIINKTREKLNRLVALEQRNQSEEVLELSRKLDILIHYYITLEVELRS